jgi:hypothetical protein
MRKNFKREYVCQIICPSCEDSHWIDVYKEDGSFYTLCFVDIEPYPLTDKELKYWKINPNTTPYAE